MQGEAYWTRKTVKIVVNQLLALKVQGDSWHGLRVSGGYTWSHSYDNAASGQFPLVPSTIWNPLLRYQLFGSGSPFGFILGGIPGTRRGEIPIGLRDGTSLEHFASASYGSS